MRLLTKFSLSKKLKFEWAQETDSGWEARTLTSIEPPDPDLIKAYNRLKFLVQYVAGFRGNVSEVVNNLYITEVRIQHEKRTSERNMQIKAGYYVSSAGDEIKIILPPINPDIIPTLINGTDCACILDDLERECFKYVDGCRAQQVLNFEKAAEMAEEKRTS